MRNHNCGTHFFIIPTISKFHIIAVTMKKYILTAAIALAAGCAVAAPAGPWWGKLSLGVRGSLRIVIDLTTDPADGRMTATLKSPDQSEQSIPASVDFCSHDSIAVSVAPLGAAYRAHVTDGRMSGIFTQGGASFPLDMIPGDGSYARPQTPTAPSGYTTEEVRFVNHAAGDTLAGTLCVPDGATKATPVVLLVTGSGLQNRDEELAGHRPFAVIADRLAREGIASLRYDDRGFGESTGNGTSATTYDFASDASAGTAYLRGLDRFGSVGVLGHSEGGTIAVMLAGDADVNASPDFIISLAGGMVPGRDILITQNRKMLVLAGYSPEIADTYCSALKGLWGGDTATAKAIDTSALPQELRTNLLMIPMHTAKSPWTKTFLALDPSEYIRNIKCPVMAVNGTLDCQVDAADNLGALERELPAGTPRHLVTCHGLNHLLQPAITGMPDEYSSIAITVAPEVLDDVTAWIKSVTAGNK